MSGLRRVLLIVAAFAVADFVRSVLPPTPMDVEQWRPGMFFRRVKVEGLVHAEHAASYENVLFYARGNSLHPLQESDVISRRPWVLIPLNKPERSGGLLVVAELAADEARSFLGTDQVEFEGVLGPMPDEVLEAVWKTLRRESSRPQ